MKFFVLLVYICLALKCGHPINLKNYYTSTTPFSSADHEISFPACANCSSEKNFRTNTDFHCHFEDDSAIEENFGKWTNSYPDCLPDHFIATRKIKAYCCFWSPKLGCSALIGRKFYDKKIYSCKTCRRFCSATKQTYVDDSDGSDKVSESYGFSVLLAFLLLSIY
uniref:Uncharacterized protein n=2 Tax=Drosophila melanogaster TaxID=7227 RepID=A8JNW0_DROME|eukprot:NP_001097648.1 uncharacterized protein Dmel_CG34258 [Drosophila melanogaster]